MTIVCDQIPAVSDTPTMIVPTEVVATGDNPERTVFDYHVTGNNKGECENLRWRRTALHVGIVGDDPDEPFSDAESDSEHDGSPAKFVHKLARIPLPQRTARPATSAGSSPATGSGGHQAVSWASRAIVAFPLVKSVRNHALAKSEA